MRVVPVVASPIWEPNCPDARLLADDSGHAALALRAHPEDSDSRAVVLLWRGVRRATIGGPNDEGLHEHELYAVGLRDLLWMGRVVNDEALPASQRWILPLRECVVEVVADSWAVVRLPGATSLAGSAALAGEWGAVEFRVDV